MSGWLVEFSIGPVQGFIAAARRSRDLWAGSDLLSEVVRALARSLLGHGAHLIYPLRSRVEAQRNESNLSNVVLAELPDITADEVRSVVRATRLAALSRLKEVADREWTNWVKANVNLRGDFWERQISQALDIYAAWAVYERVEAYRQVYGDLKSALAARKNTRTFEPSFPASLPSERNELSGFGIPKCSLDGAAESVLPPDRRHYPLQFGLSPGEQLDALGCIKRSYGRQQRFTALTRLAAHSWLKSLSDDQLDALKAAYEPLVRHGLASVSAHKAFELFPFDGGLLYDETRALAMSECEGPERADLESLDQVMRGIAGPTADGVRVGKPNPYVALMVADGDRMGAFVDRATCPDDHRRISAAISAFADGACEIAERHGGQVMFAGGEDLMIAFPRAGADVAATALAESFTRCIDGVADRLNIEPSARPSLRVGVAICHVLTPFGDIRQRAGAAEREAKDSGGNALAMTLHIRAGHEIRVLLPFTDAAAFEALAAWQAAYREGRIPGRLAYDVLQISQRYGYVRTDEGVVRAAMGEVEFKALLKRARERGGKECISASDARYVESRLAELRAKCTQVPASGKPDHAMQALAHELLVGRWLSAANADELGERNE